MVSIGSELGLQGDRRCVQDRFHLAVKHCFLSRGEVPRFLEALDLDLVGPFREMTPVSDAGRCHGKHAMTASWSAGLREVSNAPER
jgi:hypothetical protein